MQVPFNSHSIAAPVQQPTSLQQPFSPQQQIGVNGHAALGQQSLGRLHPPQSYGNPTGAGQPVPPLTQMPGVIRSTQSPSQHYQHQHLPQSSSLEIHTHLGQQQQSYYASYPSAPTATAAPLPKSAPYTTGAAVMVV